MPWGENDDKDVDDCIKKLTEKITKAEDRLISLRKLVEYCKQIQTRKEIQVKDNKKIIIKSKPLDDFGDEMDNKERMAKKKKCMSKTKELFSKSTSRIIPLN